MLFPIFNHTPFVRDSNSQLPEICLVSNVTNKRERPDHSGWELTEIKHETNYELEHITHGKETKQYKWYT